MQHNSECTDNETIPQQAQNTIKGEIVNNFNYVGQNFEPDPYNLAYSADPSSASGYPTTNYYYYPEFGSDGSNDENVARSSAQVDLPQSSPVRPRLPPQAQEGLLAFQQRTAYATHHSKNIPFETHGVSTFARSIPQYLSEVALAQSRAQPNTGPVRAYQRKRNLASAQSSSSSSGATGEISVSILSGESEGGQRWEEATVDSKAGSLKPEKRPSTQQQQQKTKKKPRIEKTKLFGRRHWVVKDDDKSAIAQQSEAVVNIRKKLEEGKKINKKQEKILRRDPKILAQLKTPTFIASRSGRGLSQQEIKKSEEVHARKLMGWQYHNATRAMEEKQLQQRRKNKNT
jgi:hypothetical protein